MSPLMNFGGGMLASPGLTSSQGGLAFSSENYNPSMRGGSASAYGEGMLGYGGSHPLTGLNDEQVIVPSKRSRKISKIPYKVLDAPALQDDFYLNLVDWSSTNNLAVGLSNCIYIWSASNSKVTKLHDLG
jgi:WD40 repeat protein